MKHITYYFLASECYQEEEEEIPEQEKKHVKPCVRCSFESELRTLFRYEMTELTGREPGTTESYEAGKSFP